MIIKINGKESEISDSFTIQDLISIKNLLRQAIIVELNNTIVHRESWGNTRLNQNDSLEIIRLIGGG